MGPLGATWWESSASILISITARITVRVKYYLMRQCWRALPRERPSFKELVVKFDFMLQDTVDYMDFTLKNKQGRRNSRDIAPPLNGPTTTIQYTSVLIEHDEEDSSDPESNENIGLDTLFNQAQSSPRTLISFNVSEESTTLAE
ncbi:pkinase_Tyr domain-containing protein [Nephila pilipes]|uniref:Pkinase_Tyr domain-containing protein n=1 Tax=Nephila pilipes TaxID=299642 RepID=A0A8X6MK69_NEPPI|nr:pkinase_Tyr domain-containing protein [Nephila pilipes]